MGNYEKLRLIFTISRFAMLFSLLCIAQIFVLCIGADGHIEVELPVQQSCGDCIDVPLFFATLSKGCPCLGENLSENEDVFVSKDVSMLDFSTTETDLKNRFSALPPPVSKTSALDTIMLRI